MVGQMPTTSSFIWGRGGRRRSMDDIALERRLAQQQMLAGSDFSPVQHWTQGLARVANGLAGGFRMQQADKAADEARTAQQGVIEALLAGQTADGGPDPVAAALADPELRDLGVAMWKSRQTKPVEPSIQRRNDGSIIGINPMTGEIMFEQVDPNPKPSLDWLSVKNADGTTTLVPVGVGGPMTGAPQGGPPATLPPDFDFGEGGPTTPASDNFSAGFRGLPGETVTSTYRDPARNRRVGGVPNSYHTRRDAQGNPLARDSVPPPGMSMGTYHRELQRRNPHLQVINEGDHVHMEPR